MAWVWTVQTVIYRLETYIGNIVDWKHQNRLETKFLDWKHDDEIGNKKSKLETMNLDWKQNSWMGNSESRAICRLETYIGNNVDIHSYISIGNIYYK